MAGFAPGVRSDEFVGLRSSGGGERLVGSLQPRGVNVGHAANLRPVDEGVAFQCLHAALSQSDEGDAYKGDGGTA